MPKVSIPVLIEATAAVTIALYLGALWISKNYGSKMGCERGLVFIVTGICVGAGTVAFFLLFQRGGPLSAVPMILAGGAAIMAVAGILFFKEPASVPRLLGIVLGRVCNLTARG